MRLRNMSGFTLIELLIVLAIAAIIATVAATSYGEYTERARRTDAKTTLTATASTLERCRALYGTYSSVNCSIANGDSITSPKGYYTISVVSTPTTFILTSAAQGIQTADADCLAMTLDELGQQGGTTANCW